MNNYVSILIPIFNGIEFLNECLNSIKNQTYKNWEIIIGINGHSPNSSTYKIASQHKCNKIKINEYNNPGKASTLNKMILDAKYDIICLLDVDDKWHSEKLEYQIKIKKNYDIVGTLCKYFGNNDICPPIPKKKINSSIFLKMNPIINSSCMLNKNLCYWKENYILEDYDLWLKLNYMGKSFYNIPHILTYHRIHDTSFYNNQNHDHVQELRQKWSNIYKHTYRDIDKSESDKLE